MAIKKVVGTELVEITLEQAGLMNAKRPLTVGEFREMTADVHPDTPIEVFASGWITGGDLVGHQFMLIREV